MYSSALCAQEEVEGPYSLEEQYEKLMKKSTSYQEYKVVKKVGINELWKNVNDSLNKAHSDFDASNDEIARLNKELKSTKDSLDQTSASLNESNFGRDRISFLGIPLLKITYNSIVWGIILILAAIAIILFMRFAKSNSVTKNTRADYNKLEEEFEEYKKNARENDINIKRELQTAINTIEDLKR